MRHLYNRQRLTLESRAEGFSRVIGYGSVFYNASDPGTEYQLAQDAVERIMPGSFDRAIREDDIRSFFNHDANLVLGRSTAGTLALDVDSVGLRYTVNPPDTRTIEEQVIEPIRRGDVTGSSFMFRLGVNDARWSEEEREDGPIWVRNIEQFSQVLEVGPVVFPAYTAASSGLRSEELREVEAELAAAKLSLAETKRRKRRARQERRLRAIEIDSS